MIEPESAANLEVERLIRASLDRDAERVDPRPLFDRIIAEVAPGGRRRRRWPLLATAAAVLAVACLPFVRADRKAMAKGEAVVREARRAHSMPVDRCYLVEVRRESPLAAQVAPRAAQVRQTRLWTRGDRFWVESVRPDQRWAWGRDESGRVWLAFGPHSAVKYEAEEVPDWLNLYLDLHSLDLDRWLADVIDRFDLDREEDRAGDASSTILIRARARDVVPIGPGVQSAEIEVDAETRVIRRLVVRRVWDGEPLATVTYTLAETDARDPAEYQVEGHLADPSEIFTRDHEPQRRKELVTRWFGNRPGRLLRGLEPPKRL